VRTDRDQQSTWTAGRLPAGAVRLRNVLRTDDARAQFVRFVAAGAVANVLYGVLFLVLGSYGSQPANVVGALASSALANELHRRLTFRAGARVRWPRAQWEGGSLAVAGTVATSLALARFDAVVADADAVAHLSVVAVVTGAVGLIRFAALRWVFTAGRRGTSGSATAGVRTRSGILAPASA
jgi:putative flippase GtrA